mmetsp:Transcript_19505/g.56127  ORF Transcript_19505/g.56127 Transcript_19505/m.56127 type:complete len:210 (+) Transcript_19505:8141-8770(+)
MVPQQTDGKLREGKPDAQSREYRLPVPLLERLCLHIRQKTLASQILLDHVVQVNKGVVLSDAVREGSQLDEDVIKALPNLAHCGDGPRRILKGTEGFIWLAHGPPNLFDVQKLVEAGGKGIVASCSLEIKRILCLDEVLLVELCLLKAELKRREYIQCFFRGEVPAQRLLLFPLAQQLGGSLSTDLVFSDDTRLEQWHLLTHYTALFAE